MAKSPGECGVEGTRPLCFGVRVCIACCTRINAHSADARCTAEECTGFIGSLQTKRQEAGLDETNQDGAPGEVASEPVTEPALPASAGLMSADHAEVRLSGGDCGTMIWTTKVNGALLCLHRKATQLASAHQACQAAC